MDDQKFIVVISDGTGRTAKRLLDAVLSQYAGKDINFGLVRTYGEVREPAQFDKILEEIEGDYLVVFSIVSKEFGAYIAQKLTQNGILHLNVLEPMINTMSKFLGVHPNYRPGILQIIDDSYYRKIDAIGYTVEHDDGLGPAIENADLILLGVSRTCKTPISMFLACNYGLKVANIPLVSDHVLLENVVKRLKNANQLRVVGLIMQPDVLARVREERFHYMANTLERRAHLDDYHDPRAIAREIRFCTEFYRTNNWWIINVTRRAIEEISREIIETLNLNVSRIDV